jgi:hypothetical protein
MQLEAAARRNYMPSTVANGERSANEAVTR